MSSAGMACAFPKGPVWHGLIGDKHLALRSDGIKRQLSIWLTLRCGFNFVLADKLRTTPETEFPKMVRLQDMRNHPVWKDWIVRKTLVFEDACFGEYAHEFLAVSHRWEASGDPDSTGAQLKALRVYLAAHPHIKFVFYDLMSLPQGRDKTGADGLGISITTASPD